MASILEIILKTIRQGRGTEETTTELTRMQRAIDQAKTALGAFGIALSAQQGFELAKDLANSARAANDAKGALTAAATGMATYTEAMEAGKTATHGMVSETQLASSLSTIFGAGLAKNATEAAQLANAGTILSNVFAAAGASQELYVRLLSSGSIQLFNNFGITNQMVQAKQKEIEATTQLTGEEARLAAIKATLIDNAQKYQSALSDDTRASAEFQAAVENAKVALGQFILPEFTEAMVNYGGAVRWATEGLDEMNPALRGAVGGLIDVANPLATVNELFESGGELAAAATPPTDDYTSSIYDLNAAAQASGPALDNYANSIYGVQIQAREAAIEVQNLAQQQSNMNLRAAKEAAPELGARITEQRKQVYDLNKTKEDAEKTSNERAAKQMSTAFAKAADDIGNVIGGKLQTTFQDVFKLPEGAGDKADEPARRLATIAAAGFGSEWLTELNAQFAGQSFWTPIATAIQSGNQEELKAAATTALQNFSQGLVPQLWDVEVIKGQVRAQMAQQNIKAQLIETVKKELGAEGIGAAVGVVEMAAGDVAVATDTASTAVTGMQTTVETAGAGMATSYDGAILKLQNVEQIIMRVIGLTQRWGEVTQSAVDKFNSVGPGASQLPTDAQKKMGSPVGVPR